MSTLDLDPDFLSQETEDRYERDLQADDLSQILADEDRDALLLEQAERRMVSFAELGLEAIL